MSLTTGQIIDGKYKIVRLLGEGGMGAVYEGENTRIHRKVAIKVLHAGVAAKADVVQRFEREAQAAGRIGSEHIVEVLDLGNLPEGERYMVMEYMDGDSLGERIKKKKKMPPREVAPIIHQLLEGLSAAHAAGIIHRDLKPDNVYLLTNKNGQRDFVKVLDFGVSKFSALDTEMSMTRTGAVMGTPYYMSPEQARGAKIDNRSDLYSVGVVMYQAVTGRVPFNAETFNELVFKIALEAPEPAELVTPDLDAGFSAIIHKAMTRDAAQRFQTAKDFQAAVAQWMMTGASQVGQQQGGYPSQGGGLPSQAGFPQQQQQQQQQQQGGFPSNPSFPSNPQFSHSQATGGPFGQSGIGQGSPLNQSGSGLGQSGQQLGASQAGMAMTGPQKSGSGAMIAIGLIGTLVLAGGGFGAYKLFGSRPTSNASPVTTSAPVTTSSPTAAQTAAPVPTSEPSTEPTAAEPVALEPTAEPATPSGPTPVAHGGGHAPAKKAVPSATPTAALATPPPAKGGRSVGSDL